MENRIKEQQLDLFADRTSTQTFDSNQLRLWLSSMAYVLLQAFRQNCLKRTSFALCYSWNNSSFSSKAWPKNNY